VPTLTSYTPLDTSILNPDLSFEMDNIHEMKISYSKKKMCAAFVSFRVEMCATFHIKLLL